MSWERTKGSNKGDWMGSPAERTLDALDHLGMLRFLMGEEECAYYVKRDGLWIGYYSNPREYSCRYWLGENPIWYEGIVPFVP